MSASTIPVPAQSLQRRLEQGADILFDMEQRGDTGAEYRRWLTRWTQMLHEYESQDPAELRAA